jgi:ribosomal protein S12 methylthiotransferase accessory factor
MGRIGVTRIGEVTHLDRPGLPNFVAVRPRDAEPGISYYNGKGATRRQARASAMMEAIERYSGERCDLPVVVASYEDLARGTKAVDPATLLAPRGVDARPGQALEWVQGYDVIRTCTVYVPLCSVVCPYQSSRVRAPWYSSTNGLASGNTREEALCHALCEVLERDGVALYYASTRLRRETARILASVGRRLPEPAARGPGYARISLDSLPPRASRLARRLTRAGLRVFLRDLTSPIGIATVECTITERKRDASVHAHAGYGCHPDARVAVVRALTEAAQSRLGCIQGGREDLPDLTRWQVLEGDPDEILGGGPEMGFDAIPSREHHDVRDDVATLLEHMTRDGLDQAIAVDLTRPELGEPVVRVVVPKAEAWTTFYLHTGHGLLGPRSLKALSDGPPAGLGA